MSQKDDHDESSFEDLVKFSAAPPRPGDVHDARTVVAELPKDVLASLRDGDDLDGAAADLSADARNATRRARPFELERALAAVATRASTADTVPPPVTPEVAAAIAFAAEPPAFPPAIEMATSVAVATDLRAEHAPADARDVAAPDRAAPDAPNAADAPDATEKPSRSSLRLVLGLVALCIFVAMAVKTVLPLVRHRLHFE